MPCSSTGTSSSDSDDDATLAAQSAAVAAVMLMVTALCAPQLDDPALVSEPTLFSEHAF